MLFDELNLHILTSFYDAEKDISVGQVTHSYKWEDLPNRFEDSKIKKRYWENKLHVVITRLKSMADEGIIKISERKIKGLKRNIYIINRDKIIKSLQKFPDKRGMALKLKIDNKWCIFEL